MEREGGSDIIIPPRGVGELGRYTWCSSSISTCIEGLVTGQTRHSERAEKLLSGEHVTAITHKKSISWYTTTGRNGIVH